MIREQGWRWVAAYLRLGGLRGGVLLVARGEGRAFGGGGFTAALRGGGETAAFDGSRRCGLGVDLVELIAVEAEAAFDASMCCGLGGSGRGGAASGFGVASGTVMRAGGAAASTAPA